MAKMVKNKKKDRPEPIRDEDNPSMINVGGKLCLRVFEDFFVEESLPKWKRFKEMKKDFVDKFGSLDITDDALAKSVLVKSAEAGKSMDQKEVKELRDRIKSMQAIVSDDRWGIKDKHEREVNEAIKKCAVTMEYRPTTLMGKISKFFDRFKRHPKYVPVEIAFEDLKEHMEMSSSDAVRNAGVALDRLIENYNKVGQYAKAEEAKKLKPMLAGELAVLESGFTKYITEAQMLEFLKKSERGVMVNFMRYYEGVVPDEVVKMKLEADEKGLFDNYVVVYYCDTVKKAMSIAKKEKVAKKDAATATRRDPILFGIVKHTRKLYYIADWVTPEDDLTLDVLEKVLGEKAKTLFEFGGEDTKASLVTSDLLNSISVPLQGDNRNNSSTYSATPAYLDDAYSQSRVFFNPASGYYIDR